MKKEIRTAPTLVARCSGKEAGLSESPTGSDLATIADFAVERAWSAGMKEEWL